MISDLLRGFGKIVTSTRLEALQGDCSASRNEEQSSRFDRHSQKCSQDEIDNPHIEVVDSSDTRIPVEPTTSTFDSADASQFSSCCGGDLTAMNNRESRHVRVEGASDKLTEERILSFFSS